MPIGALTIGSLIAGAASSAAKMGGQIAGANKLRRAQPPESVYAQRYNQSFQNALNADLNQRMRATGMANTRAGQIASAQNLVNALNTPGAAMAAQQEAARFTDMKQQGVRQQAQAAQQLGGAVGTGLGFLSSGLGALDAGLARDAMQKEAQSRADLNSFAAQEAQADAQQLAAGEAFAAERQAAQAAADQQRIGAIMQQEALDQTLGGATMPRSIYDQTPEGMIERVNPQAGLNQARSLFDQEFAATAMTPTVPGTTVKP